jgi:hypothetical protein
VQRPAALGPRRGDLAVMRDVVAKHALRVGVGDLCGAPLEHCVHGGEQGIGTRVVRRLEHLKTRQVDAQRLIGTVGTAARRQMGQYVLDVGTRLVDLAFGELDAREPVIRSRC